MRVYVLGNSIVRKDSAPVRMLASVRNIFHGVEFVVTDPTDAFIPEEGSLIIDTVVGLNTPTEFRSLDGFEKSPGISAHDYDLYLHLGLLLKLGKIRSFRLLGIPEGTPIEVFTAALTSALSRVK